jgi:hypothetical protein
MQILINYMRLSRMTTFKQFLIEKRKNPEQNPKVSINDEIHDAYYGTDDTIPDTDIKNCFVSFTEIEKLGINPRSHYNTPLGIYAYPAKYIVTYSRETKSMEETVPFAGEQGFANIFSVKGNIIDIVSMSDDEAAKYYRSIGKYWSSISGKSWKESVDELEVIIHLASKMANFTTRTGGRFWYVTMEMSNLVSRALGIKVPVAWNKLFREIGIDGIVDTGVGIIHTNEPTQAVFFSKSVIKNNKLVHNKYSPSDIDKSKNKGEIYKAIKRDFNKIPFDKFFQKYRTSDINKALTHPRDVKLLIDNFPEYYAKRMTPKQKTPEIVTHAILSNPDNLLLTSSYYINHQVFKEVVSKLYNTVHKPLLKTFIENAGWVSNGAPKDARKNLELIMSKYPDLALGYWKDITIDMILLRYDIKE